MGVQLSTKKKPNSTKKSLLTTTEFIPTSPSNIEMEYLETFILVWLDLKVDKSEQNQTLQKRLRQYTTSLVTFNDLELCEQWIKTRLNDEKILFIVSGALGRKILPNIHQLKSIIAIYVFCLRPQYHITWTKDYSKVRAVISEPNTLLQHISNDLIYFENIENLKTIQIFTDHRRTRVVNSEIAPFIWYQLFLEILLSSSYLQASASSTELVQILRQYSLNEKENLNLIEEFERTYDKQQCIVWLINNTILARFLNKAICEEDVSMLFYLRFFLIDIYNQLRDHQLDSAHVYRKQLMTLENIENIRTNLNQYLSFNGFLITSTKKPAEISSSDIDNNQFQNVLIEIDATNRDGSMPFVSIQQMTNLNNDSDIVFMCGAIFKIISLTNEYDSTWILQLSLASDTDLNILTDRKQKFQQSKDLFMIVDLLDQCKQEDKANVYCQHLLQQLSPDHVLIPHLKERLHMDAKLLPESLRTVQFVLIGLTTHFNQLASAMLTTLQSLTNDSILIYDNSSKFDFETMPDTTILVFTTNQIISTMTNISEQQIKFFILEEDKNRVDQRKRFDNCEDLMFQLADELYRYYKLEAIGDTKLGNISLAKEKEEKANRIHIELKEVHQRFSHIDTTDKSEVCITTKLIWLQSTYNTDDDMIKIQNLFENILPSFLIFTNKEECHYHICTTEMNHIVFLIMDTIYKDSSAVGFQQFDNVKNIYFYDQSPSTKTYNNACFQLTHDLISYYNKLGNELSAKKDPEKAKDMFVIAQKLCELLIEL
ncbi:unnamed protein product [Adineta steineri]|uniref:Uncharacterized protein n=1 Tax=Adineta steineri TaxID=433720 RepID=A0A819VWZ3_9BILA|nr:unnamed protein product [Adineta steineri]